MGVAEMISNLAASETACVQCFLCSGVSTQWKKKGVKDERKKAKTLFHKQAEGLFRFADPRLQHFLG